MGNPRDWTTKFNANNEAMKRLLRRKGCNSMSKRKAAMERAASMPNRLDPLPRSASLKQGKGAGE